MQHEARSTADTDLIGILDLHAAQIAPLRFLIRLTASNKDMPATVCTDLDAVVRAIRPVNDTKHFKNVTFQHKWPRQCVGTHPDTVCASAASTRGGGTPKEK